MIENLTEEHKIIAERATRIVQECIARPLGTVAGAAEALFTSDANDREDSENDAIVSSR